MPNGSKPDISKIVFIIAGILLFCGLSFSFGLYSGAKRTALYFFTKDALSDLMLVYEERGSFVPNGEPIHFLQPSRKPGSGVTVNERPDDGSLVLLSGFFDGSNELRLVRRDGSPVARWPVAFSEHFSDSSHMEFPPKSDRNIDLDGALIHPDGTIVFNHNAGGTVKLSRCGETIWTLVHSTHHTIEAAEGGGYWIPGLNHRYESDPDGFPPFTRMGTDKMYREDLILKVSEDGAITEQVSVPRILYDNGLEPLMTAGGYSFWAEGGWERELVHLNKVGELPSAYADAFAMFEAGDLVVSLRGYNLVFVVDPDDWSIKWHQTGPWRRQHDPVFNPDGTISIFNNNIYRLDLGDLDRTDLSTPRVSNIIKVDPATGRSEVVYGEREGQEFLSVIRGKHNPTPEGGFLITEYEAGRAFEVDAQGRTVWEYINRYDDEWVLEMTGAWLYPASYFTVEDWSCPATPAS